MVLFHYFFVVFCLSKYIKAIDYSNILLFNENVVKLADFGVVKFDTKSSTFVGKRQYMSPEQLRGTAYCNKTDMW